MTEEHTFRIKWGMDTIHIPRPKSERYSCTNARSLSGEWFSQRLGVAQA